MKSGRPDEDMSDRYDSDVNDEHNFRILMERIELEKMYRKAHLVSLPLWKRALHWLVYWFISTGLAAKMFTK